MKTENWFDYRCDPHLTARMPHLQGKDLMDISEETKNHFRINNTTYTAEEREAAEAEMDIVIAYAMKAKRRLVEKECERVGAFNP